MPDFVVQYNEGKTQFRITDGECYSDPCPMPTDGSGLALVSFGDEEDEDMYLVAVSTYTGEEFEADTVYDISACDTEVEEDVDLSVEPEASVEDDEGEEG